MGESIKPVVERFMRLLALLHRYQLHNFMNFGPWGNPHRGQGRVLAMLKMKPEISQRELTYLLGMSKQALGELLNKLEKSGYIKREASEEDRRSLKITLTEEGAFVANEMDDTPPDLENLFDVFNDEELANLNEYLQRIIERLADQFTGEDEDLHRQMMERFMRQHGHHFGDHEHPFGSGDFSAPFGGRFSHGGGGRHSDDEGNKGR